MDQVAEEYLLLASTVLEGFDSLASTTSLPTVVGVGEATVADGESEIILPISKVCLMESRRRYRYLAMVALSSISILRQGYTLSQRP